jgi:protein-disulfide isomerase
MSIQQGVLRVDVHEGDHIKGPADAPVTLVEYGDFECPHCCRAHPIILSIQKRMGDRLRFVYRNFPLPELHPHALHAAAAAEAVGAHAGPRAYWAMHDAIFEHQKDSGDALDDSNLVRYAADAGADPGEVRQDLAKNAFADRVQEDFMGGVRSGVNGTPTFFINGERFDGDWTNQPAFEFALEQAAAARPHAR